MIGAQLDSTGTDARGPEPETGDKSGGSVTQVYLDAKPVFGSNADECAVSVAGSIHPSSDGAICSGLRTREATGAISRTSSNGGSKSCPS